MNYRSGYHTDSFEEKQTVFVKFHRILNNNREQEFKLSLSLLMPSNKYKMVGAHKIEAFTVNALANTTMAQLSKCDLDHGKWIYG